MSSLSEKTNGGKGDEPARDVPEKTRGENALTEEISRLDAEHSWHPFTQMREYLEFPRLQIARGKGCWLYDTEGKKYLDANASIWTNTLGHCDADLDAALREQLGAVAHSTMLGLSSIPSARLAGTLAALTQNRLPRVFFSDCGAAAVEVAVKLSFQYWQLVGEPQRTGVIAMSDAYHGDTFGAMALGDCGAFHSRFKHWFFPVDRFPAPECVEVHGNVLHADARRSLEALEAILEKKSDTTACVLIEPEIQGSGGMKLQPPGFVEAVSALCKNYGVHLILDEIFVGFGRTGKFLIEENRRGIDPDFVCVGKGLTGGYMPLAATLAREEIYEAFLGSFDEYKAFFHGHTFTGNPLACAVAQKNYEKIAALIASGTLADTIDYLGRRVEETFAGHAHVREIRQRGMVAALDLFAGAGKPDWEVGARTGMKICMHARERGLILRPLVDTLVFIPPLVISHDEIDFLVENTRASIDEFLASRGE